MIEGLLAMPGPALLGMAGFVHGFAGFGSALLFLPVASIIVPPVAVAAFPVATMSSVSTVLPGAWARADRRLTVTTVAAAAVAMPAGVWTLRHVGSTALRWTSSGLEAATLAAVIAELRLGVGSGTVPRSVLGELSGVVGGATGLLGPVVILVGLGGRPEAARMGPNRAAVLAVPNLALPPRLAMPGALGGRAVWLGAALAVPYTPGAPVGRRLFAPTRERLPCCLAHAVVGASVAVGLPLFD